MTRSTSTGRSVLMRSADVKPLSRWQRILRLQFWHKTPPAPETIQALKEEFDPSCVFTATTEGSGIFGRWTLDESALPAYDYELDQYVDARAKFPNSENMDRRDHWHQIGNRKVTALASNDGTIQVYLGDRGGVFLNKFEAWAADRPAAGILAFLARIVLALVRLIARIHRPTGGDRSAQPFASQSAETQSIRSEASKNPRNSLKIAHLRDIQEETTEPLLQSYSLLSAEAEPIVQAADAPSDTPMATRDTSAMAFAYAGGFGYIDDGVQVWATAFRYRPQGAMVQRRFGVGYAESSMAYRSIRTTRRVYAPLGDYPLVIADVTLQNIGSKPITVKHYEYWDVNVQQLQLEWLRGGAFGAASDEERRQVGRQFANSIHFRADEMTLEFRQDPPTNAPPADQPSPVDWYPAPVFLADLSGQVDAHYINKAAFFGAGGAFQPDAVRLRTDDGSLQPHSRLEPMPYCMVLRREVSLDPGQKRTLRYAYGAAYPEARRAMLNELKHADLFERSREQWQDDLVYFRTGDDPVLQREMAWHSYNLLSATVYNAYHNVHLIPQGSAYLYLHGADGAPRDQALFSLALTYVAPELAKDVLRLIMRLTDGKTGQIPYAFCGHGYTSNGLNIHTNPSDLDLFFLLAMSEYLAATRDFKFLKEEVPFYPPDRPSRAGGTTVLEHIRFALKHLFEMIGIGDNGLIRVRTGDWSDSIVLETALKDGPLGVAYQNSKLHGESVPNTQMALYVLPLLANVLEDDAPDITAMLQDGRVERLQAAVEGQWNDNGWYNRAVLRGVSNQPIKMESLSLEAQVWGLISGAAKSNNHEGALLERIDASLDRPSAIGATLTEGGMIWPAISQLLTWGYARAGKAALAWRSLNRNTFAMHAEQFPAVWFGIWGAPDGINNAQSTNPGGTWASALTPMTDFPTMNANPDAMALLGLLRVCGVEPAPDGKGLVIRPQVPRKRFVLETKLLRLEVEGTRLRGEYRPQFGGKMNIYVYAPGSAKMTPFLVEFFAGQRVKFEVGY